MGNTGFRNTLLGTLSAVMLVTGCASGGGEMKDEWLARVPQEQMSGVESARAGERQALDDVNRAEVAKGDAERALEVAKSQRDSAKSSLKADETSLEAATAQGQAPGITSSTNALETGKLKSQAVDAQVVWREKDLAAAEANIDLRREQVKVAEAQRKLAQYQALRNTNDVRVKDYSENDFREALKDAQEDAAEVQEKVSKLQAEAGDAKSEFDRLNGASAQ